MSSPCPSRPSADLCRAGGGCDVTSECLPEGASLRVSVPGASRPWEPLLCCLGTPKSFLSPSPLPVADVPAGFCVSPDLWGPLAARRPPPVPAAPLLGAGAFQDLPSSGLGQGTQGRAPSLLLSRRSMTKKAGFGICVAPAQSLCDAH